jgi:uncharacterized caspase-like protein
MVETAPSSAPIEHLARQCAKAAYKSMASKRKLFTLMVGIDGYETDLLRNLEFAVDDAVALRDELANRLDVDERVCKVLTSPRKENDSVATRNEILRHLNWFASIPMGPDDTFLFSFSGHGFAIGGSSYLYAADSIPESPELARGTGISVQELSDYWQRIKAGQQIFILDACRNMPFATARGDHASAKFNEVMGRNLTAMVESERSRARNSLKGRVIVSACSVGQFSYEFQKIKHGWFTYNLLQHLRECQANEINLDNSVEQIRQQMEVPDWKLLPRNIEQQPYRISEGKPIYLRLRPLQNNVDPPVVIEVTSEKRPVKRDIAHPTKFLRLGYVALIVISIAVVVFLLMQFTPKLGTNNKNIRTDPNPTAAINNINAPVRDVGGENKEVISGTVVGIKDPENYRIVIYTCGNDGCSVQPPANPKTPIRADGSWRAHIYTGKEYAVLLVYSTYEPAAKLTTRPERDEDIIDIRFEEGPER